MARPLCHTIRQREPQLRSAQQRGVRYVVCLRPSASRGENPKPQEVEVLWRMGIRADGELAADGKGTADKLSREAEANRVDRASMSYRPASRQSRSSPSSREAPPDWWRLPAASSWLTPRRLRYAQVLDYLGAAALSHARFNRAADE